MGAAAKKSKASDVVEVESVDREAGVVVVADAAAKDLRRRIEALGTDGVAISYAKFHVPVLIGPAGKRRQLTVLGSDHRNTPRVAMADGGLISARMIGPTLRLQYENEGKVTTTLVPMTTIAFAIEGIGVDTEGEHKA